MASPGGPPSTSPTAPAMHRESRWRGQGFADMTKLRELSAKQERMGARFELRAARVKTRIDKLRHAATILREKADKVLLAIPELESEIAQLTRNIQTGEQRAGAFGRSSDATSMQLRIRKLEQKVFNIKLKSQTLQHKAAIRTQKSAELKVKVDRFMEQATTARLEAKSFLERADRLQRATEDEVAARLATGPPGSGSGAPPPGSS